ncbi:MAG: glycosyltransferase family 4 protein [Candidatus Edwardsbacteria bacterium]|nr:glycosyltransferase family 4 protein [Candidatus Edwardsbacteria bacterium]MBU2594206.1 glycosyltransferase family 4 protein [Candidatus Edwardsbacteria bacterium]
MKVAILQSPTFPLNIDYHGGIEVVELGELDYLRDKGHQSILYVPSLVGNKNGIKVIRDWGWQNRYLKWKYYLEFILRTAQCDIRHGHYTPAIALLAPDNSLVHFPGLAVSELLLYRLKWARFRYHRAHYIFCAKWVKDEFCKKYPEIPDIKLHVLYNGVDVCAFKPGVAVNRNEKIKILWYGVWEEEKGIFDLLEAIRQVEQKRDNFTVNIVGSASYEGETVKSRRDDVRVHKLAGKLNTVNLIGPIKYQQLPKYLSEHQLGIFPSTYRDPFPLVPLEMMAAGLPVIAYDLGGPKEAIVNGKTGFLVENKRPDLLAGRIEWFLDNRQAIAEMGKNARKHVEDNFSLEIHGRNLVGIYQKMMEQR